MPETAVVEQVLEVVDDASVPAALFEPATGEPPFPVVLIGHGGRGHRRDDEVVEHAAGLARRGVATVAIDGPFHGDRRQRREHRRYADGLEAEGMATVIDRMTANWRAVLRVVDGHDRLDSTRLGYLGVSMGTRYGLPLLAASGERFAGAVLGRLGVTSVAPISPRTDVTARTLADAARVRTPLLFHVQADDEAFPVPGQRALFEAFGSTDKRLRIVPGRHATTTPEDLRCWHDFLSDHLRHSGGGA